MRHLLRCRIRKIAARCRDESGVALLTVMLVSVLLLGLGLALSMNSMVELEISSSHQREMVAFYAAETGLERGIDGFRSNYTVSTLPADGVVLFNQTRATYPASNVTADYTVTVARRDSPAASPMAPYPIHYTITSVGRFVPSNSKAQASSVTLLQTVCVSPRTLANYTLFYDSFGFELAFQSTFRLSGRLAVNDPSGVHAYKDTTVNGDFYSAGPIVKSDPYGVPKVSGNIVENGGKISFPNTIDPFSHGVLSNYAFDGTTRLIFQANGTVIVHNNSLAGSPKTMSLPSNGIIAVNGNAVVEGTVHGRCTVAATDNILINGDLRYADQTPSSTDTFAAVAKNDVLEPQYAYAGVTGSTLEGFSAQWNGGHWQVDGVTGGTWGAELPADFHIDGTLVSLTGSSPTVINPAGRLPGNLYIYGNSIAKIASVTVYMNGDNISRGLNEIYSENKKLDMLPPPGFPLDTRLLPTFFSFREVRTAIQ
jgi:hypothetical protein